MKKQLFFFISILLVFFCPVIFSNENKDEILLQAVVITRHGDRTPTKVFQDTKSEWKEGLGQLTSIGIKSHFKLGQKFRTRYIENYKLLPKIFKTSNVYVRSSPKERTLMSAQSFIAGMFHIDREVLPLGFHPVPIYSVDKECDDLLYAYKNCPRLASLLMQTKDSPEWKKKTDQHSSTLNYLTEVLGAPFSLKEVTTLLNLLNAERIHNNTKTEIKPEIMQELHEIAEWVYRRKFYTREMGILGSGRLADDIRDRFNATFHLHRREQELVEKFVLFSAHDSTLLALLSALDIHHLPIPKYSDHLVFEFFFDQKSNSYYTKTFYNDELIVLPNCVEHCPFDTFNKIVDASYELDWKNKCKAIETFIPKHESTFIPIIQEGKRFFDNEGLFPSLLTLFLGLISGLLLKR